MVAIMQDYTLQVPVSIYKGKFFLNRSCLTLQLGKES